jgi:hypothetical protein
LPICKQYHDDKTNALILGQGIAFIIVIMNNILKTVTIKMIIWVGEDTQSERLTSITQGVFIAQFFNTGLVLLLVNANLTEYGPKIFTSNFNGPFPDYTAQWYSEVGYKIVQTMLINSVTPFITLFSAITVPVAKRVKDSGGDMNSHTIYNTKQTAMYGFRKLYGGGDYVIHVKYSGMLNVVFVTMMYGFGQPLLFPIGALNLFNTYLSERIIVAYTMRLPPALDSRLLNYAVSQLKWAALLFILNAYWMIGSPQIFGIDSWSYKDLASDVMKSGHKITLFKSQTAPIMYIIIMTVIMLTLRMVAGKRLERIGFGVQEKEIDVDEDLPNVYNTLTMSAAQTFIQSNKYMQENYGFEFQDPDTIERLTEIRVTPTKLMTGTPFYHLMANPTYGMEFNYIGPNVSEREKLIEDGYADQTISQFVQGKEVQELTEECKNRRLEQSDMVMVLLNLAYIPDSVIKQIDFA